jgi:hypothetical protein
MPIRRCIGRRLRRCASAETRHMTRWHIRSLLSLAVKYETLGLPINVGRAPPLATSSRAAQCALQCHPDACRLAVLYSADGSRVPLSLANDEWRSGTPADWADDGCGASNLIYGVWPHSPGVVRAEGDLRGAGAARERWSAARGGVSTLAERPSLCLGERSMNGRSGILCIVAGHCLA